MIVLVASRGQQIIPRIGETANGAHVEFTPTEAGNVQTSFILSTTTYAVHVG